MNKADILKELEKLKVTPIKDATNQVLLLQLQAAQTEAENRTLVASNESLSEDLEAEKAKNKAEVEESEKPTFKVGNKTFRFKVLSFIYKGKKYKSEEAISDKELLKTLLESEFSQIEKL